MINLAVLVSFKQLRSLVEDKLYKEYMKEDVYLVRFLRGIRDHKYS